MNICSRCLSNFRRNGTKVLVNDQPVWMIDAGHCDMCERKIQNSYLSPINDDEIQRAKRDHIKRELRNV